MLPCEQPGLVDTCVNRYKLLLWRYQSKSVHVINVRCELVINMFNVYANFCSYASSRGYNYQWYISKDQKAQNRQSLKQLRNFVSVFSLINTIKFFHSLIIHLSRIIGWKIWQNSCKLFKKQRVSWCQTCNLRDKNNLGIRSHLKSRPYFQS